MIPRIILSPGTALAISKPGKSCFSGSLDDFLVNSQLKGSRAKLAGFLTGTGTYQGDYQSKQGIYWVTAYHGLGYIPQWYSMTPWVICTTTQIALQFVVDYTGQNTPPATASTTTVADYIVFYDRWV